VGKGNNRRNSLRIGVMKEGKDILERDPILRRIVEVIVKEIDPDKIILFGSRARGNYKEDSDYDILVLKEGVSSREGRKLSGYLERKFLDEGIFDVAGVDVVVEDNERFKDFSLYKYSLYYWVAKEGVVIYDRRFKKVA